MAQLCHFGLCSNRSYCIVCPNDGLFDLIRILIEERSLSPSNRGWGAVLKQKNDDKEEVKKKVGGSQLRRRASRNAPPAGSFVVGAYNSPCDSFLRSSLLRASINLSLNHKPLCHCLIFGCLITREIMYLLIVFLPLLGSSVAGFFGRFLGKEGTAIMTTTCVSFSSILSLIAFYEVALGASACYLRIAPWDRIALDLCVIYPFLLFMPNVGDWR
ncbi:hypothetical protein Leryth_022779 [Lithospermum erythrorhizon]|nr:hypothetical protein Leryth_022779 [Lithospermum erythrorhizon]